MFNSVKRKFTGKERRRGYTLMELMAVIVIIVVIAAVAIPSAVYIRDSLAFKQKNDYAKTIFLAAQANLTEMRADGRITRLQVTDGSGTGAMSVPIQDNAGFPAEDWSAEYMYCVSGTDAYDLVLPVNSVESILRDRNILIEYNPYTGNVYSVFYSEGPAALTYNNVTRDEAQRKEMGLGYYCGSSLSSSIMEIVESKVEISYLNGEAGVLEIRVPVPEQYYEAPTEFANLLTTTITITGESLLTAEYDNTGRATEQADDTIPTNTLDPITLSGYEIVDGRYVVFQYTLDRLLAGQSFGSMAANGANLSSITDESAFRILPGQNIIVHATAQFNVPGSEHYDASVVDIVKISPDTEYGINPMFDYLIESSTNPGRYVLAVSNGRNLQNLNAIAPSVAEKVDTVLFTDDIYWNETVDFYSSSLSNTTSDAPVCDLPYFVPIHNAALFGTAKFVYLGSSIANLEEFLNAILDALMNGSSGSVPTLTDETDTRIDPMTSWTDTSGTTQGVTYAENHAQILGVNGGKSVYNVNINTAQYESQTHAASYYVGDVDFSFTGLFSYVNTTITDLNVVNPTVKGYPFVDETKQVQTGTGWGGPTYSTQTVYSNPATGALVGAAGYNTLITGCGVYIDRNDGAFNSAKLTQGDYSQTEEQNWYGVSGEGAVGGLIGYAKSHRTTTGELTGDTAHLAFANSFAAVPVSGNMRGTSSATAEAKHFGYSNGIGGFIGNSQLTNFYNCYASGDVRANGSYVAQTTLDQFTSWIPTLMGEERVLPFNGRTSMGTGGFVGTSHGTRYTNCFATGNVEGTNDHSTGYDYWLIILRVPYDYRSLGVAGFAGFMSYDETKAYGNDVEGTEIAQRTVFTNCYSVGRAEVSWSTKWDEVGPGSSALENFSGANGRIRITFADDTKFYGDYYALYAPDYKASRYSSSYAGPSFEDYYIFRHSYYLSNYYLDISTEGRENSNLCASGEGYETLIDLTAKHQNSGGWVNEQIDALMQLKDHNGKLYSTYFNENRSLTGTYINLYSEGFSSNSWCQATVENTHAYNVENAGQAYPFTMIKGLPYYGDWPEAPVSAGLAYYEKYNNGTTVYFPLNSDDVTVADDAIVVEDGYVIFIANTTEAEEATNTSIAVQMGGFSWDLTVSGTIDAADGSSAHSFNIFKLPDGYLNVQPAAGEFYVKVTAKRDTTTYILYFNPDAAMTQVNPPDYNAVDDGSGNITIAATKPDAPTTVLIRSARHFANMSRLNSILGEGVTYIQQLNIDAALYTGITLDTSVTIDPFAGTYTGSGGYLPQARLAGFEPETGGLFGTVTGTVQDLDIHYGSATVTGTGSAGFLAGVNQGTISNVNLTLGDVTVTASDNAGLLAGKNEGGTIENCTVRAGSVTLSAANAGGLVGSSCSVAATGDEAAKAAVIKNCTVELTSLTANNATYAGGIAGHAADTAFEIVSAHIHTFTANGAIAGGFVGSITGNSVLAPDVSFNSATAATFGGIAGQASEVTFTNVTVTAGTITADVAAGGFGTAQAAGVSNADIHLDSVQGTTTAAGFAGSVLSSNIAAIADVNVTVTGSVTAAGGNAAGFAESLNGTVLRCKVYLGKGTNTVTISGRNAAGFAITGSATVHECLVSGKGSITAKEAAAGFIVTAESHTVSKSVVTPVYGHNTAAYLGSSNANLTVTGQTAALFIVTNKATVSNCIALGTVTGDTAAGFIVTNEGPVELCQANTAGTGAALISLNNSAVTNCYAWYTDGTADAIGEGETGTYYGCFFAHLTTQADTSTETATVFPGNGYAGADGKTSVTVYLDGLSADLLNGTKSNAWQVSGANAYCYSSTLASEAYGYPQFGDHYGDWTIPPRYAYGLAYYEIMSDGSIRLQLQDISHLTAKPNIHGGPISLDDILAGDALKDAAGAQLGIVEAGYAVFGRGSSIMELQNATLRGDTLDSSKLSLEGLSSNVTADFFRSNYNFYVLDTGNAQEVTVYDGDNSSAFCIPLFARTIGQTAAPYEIRTPEQFAAIKRWYDANGADSFTQTHDLDLTGLEYTPVTVVSYAGNGSHITTDAPLFAGVSGTASNLTIQAHSLNGSLFGSLSGTLDRIAATVTEATFAGSNGVLASDNSGTIGNCQINQGADAVTVTINSATDTVFGGLVGTNSGTITDSCANVSITYSGSADVVTIGGFVGRMDSGNLQDCTAEGAITKSGTVSTAIIGGAVGAENADSTSAGYTNVTSTVHVDTAWANADTTVDTSCETPAGQGPVGTFIGYVNDGTFTGCSTADAEGHQNTAFHFLGEAHLDTGNFTKDVWSADKLYSGGFTSYQESGKYTIVNADGASLTEQDSYIYVPAQLSGCTFRLSGATYNQVIGTDKYHYQLASDRTLNIYSAATRLTAGFGSEKDRFSYSSLVPSLSDTAGTYTVEDTGYYYKKGSSYYKVSVTVTVKNNWFLGKKYKFTLFGYTNDGTRVDLHTSKEISSSEIPRKYLSNIYDAPTVSSPTSGQEYALVTSDGAYALGYDRAPLTWSGSFRQHETLGQQVRWTYDGSSWINSGSDESYAITNEALGLSENCYSAATFDVSFKLNMGGAYVEANRVDTFHLYAVSSTGTYMEGTFSRYTGQWDRQTIRAAAVDSGSNASEPAVPAASLPETEALIPEKVTLPEPDNSPSGHPGGADETPNE